MSRENPALTRREMVRATAAIGAAGGVVGSAGSAAAQGGETHTVDMTDGLVFDPDEISIAPGDTVVWENVGSVGHSVTAYEGDIPDEAEYFASGGFDNEQAARDGYPEEGDIPGGESYEHTFEVEGTYEYFCIPHESAGMLGTVVVGGDGGGGGGDGGDGGDGGGGGGPPTVPESARSLGVISIATLLSVLGLSYFFMKFGGDYEIEGD